ncbi:MAG: signal transduction histidine kinase [Ignavibacteria bacterium]|nr:MAG: signal transduction histidine kinase [Ignavibacteria bacterium]
MKRLLKYLLTIILLFLSSKIISQTPPYYHYTSSDGLASSTVYDVLQDKDGFMWFGTLNGLSKFNGKDFTTFTVADGLNSNVITSLAKGDSGKIYIANYENGINLFKNGKFENYRNKIDGRNFNTTFLLKSPEKVYAYTSFGNIYVFDENSKNGSSDHIIRPYIFHMKRPSFLQRLAKLSNDNVVALTSEGLFRINNSKLIKMNTQGLPETDLYCITESGDGSYFIGAKGCVYQVKDNRVIKSYRMDAYYDKIFYQIYCDRNNNIWFSVLGKGFFTISHGSNKIINLGKKLGLENTQIDCFFEDAEGNIWIGTYGKGVYCLNNLYLRNFTENDGLNNNNIICFEKEKSGKLLIGTINGISILENGVIDRLKDNSGKVVSGYVNSIICYDDYIYVSWSPETPLLKELHYKGLKFRFIIGPSFIKTVNNEYVYGSTGNALAFTEEYKSSLKGTVPFPIFGDNLFQNRVNDIIEDSRNNIWVGTSLGLCKLSAIPDKSKRNIWKKTFFPDNHVLNSKINSIYCDNNNVWFTGVNGIAKYNLSNDSVKNYSRILGNNLSTPTSVAIDNKNRIWIGTMKGLYLLDGNSIKFLSSQTGLPSDEVLSLLYDEGKNLLYIGTSNGMTLMDISSFDSYRNPSLEVKVTRIRAGDSVFTNTNKLVFEPEQHNVYISFTALSFSTPSSVKYKYSLNGEWEETEHNFLDFTSLEYGKYELLIAAKSPNSEWGKPYTLLFEVKPRFYETIWYKGGILSILVVISVIVVTQRLRIKNKKIEQELSLTERINELKHQALSAMMNPHFIFNSLNSVQYLINCQRNEEANDYIATMAKLIRKNLDTAGDGFILLSEEINRLKLYLDLEKLRFQDKFSYEIIIGTDVDTATLMIPNMIIQPFVENTLWHGIINSGIKGVVTISFSFEEIDVDSVMCLSLIIKIADNGIGINEAKKNKKEDHISKGIQIIEERLRLLSTKMQLPKPIMFEDLSSRNDNSHGTEVIISLPPPLYKIANPDSDTSTSPTD